MTAKPTFLAVCICTLVAFRAFSASPPPLHDQIVIWKVESTNFHAPSGFNKYTSWRAFYTRVGPYPNYDIIADVAGYGGYWTPAIPEGGAFRTNTIYNVLDGSTLTFQWCDGDGWTVPETAVWYACSPASAPASGVPIVVLPETICLSDQLNFSVQPLPADGISTSQASILDAACFPNGIDWEILPPDLGCTINPTNGLITSGLAAGTIRVHATDKNIKSKSATGNLQLTNCVGCTENSCEANSEVANKSVDIRIDLGGAEYGKLAGYLHIKTNLPSVTLATPSTNILRFYAGSTTSEEIIVSTTTGERQYKTPNILAWIKTNSAYKYTIQLWTNSSLETRSPAYGPFTNKASTSPFTTWTIENPDGSTASNKLTVTENRFGQTITNNYQYLGSGWELSMYNGDRKETRTTSSTNGVDTETYTITNNVLRYQTVRTYYNFPWARELTNEVIGTGSHALTNTRTFYQSTNDGNNYTHFKRKTDPYGRWELYTNYDSAGRVGLLVQQFKDNTEPSSISSSDSSNRVTILTYSSSAPQEEVLVKLQGQEVEHRYRGIIQSGVYNLEILAQCQSTGVSSWTTAGNLMQTNWTYRAGQSFYPNYPYKTRYPDGTMAFYSYFTTNGVLATVVKKGTPDSGATSIVQGKGTRTVTRVDTAGNLVSEYVFASIESDDSSQCLYKKLGNNPDDFGRRTQFTFLDGTTESTLFGCCGSQVFTNRSGVVTTNQYDDFRRLSSVSSSAGVTTTYDYDVAGRLRKTIRTGSDSSTVYLNRSVYDDAGRLTSSTNALGHPTTFAENVVTREKTTTLPNNSTRIETYFQDGSLKRLSGTSVNELEYDYGADSNGEYSKEIRVRGSAKEEWVSTYRDMIGRSYYTVYPINGGLTASNRLFYNNLGQLTKNLDPDSVTNLFEYNDQGELIKTAVDLNNNSAINDSVDRVTQSTNVVTTHDSTLVRRKITKVWDDISGSSTEILAATEDVSADEADTWLTSYGQTTQRHVAYDASNRRKIVTETFPDSSKIVTSYLDDRLQFVARTNNAGGQISKVTYSYDPHGRLKEVIDARNGTNSFVYYDDDRVSTNTSPVPGFGDNTRQVTSYQYNDLNSSGRVETTTYPDGGAVVNEYFLTGELKKTSGARTYQVEYTYEQGRVKTLKTWTNTAVASPATTTWSYTTNRGFLDRKTYDDGKYTSYEYSKAGRLTKRTWARGVVTDYTYNRAGDLAEINYSDVGGNPDVTYAYNRRGLPTNVVDLAGTHALSYYLTNSVIDTETNTSGVLSGLAVHHHYDSNLRRDYLEVLGSPQTVKHQYDYDTAGRMWKVYEGTNTHVTYAYHTDSPLIQTVTFRGAGSNGAVVMTRTNNYDYLNRLKDTTSAASNLFSFIYQYNSANQRTRVTREDSSYWSYQYDELGQVTNGVHYWSDTSPVAGQQFDYTFDHIGNRTKSHSGGDQWGMNRRLSTYSPNQLNQHTSRKVPGSLDILGTAHASATVTVDSTPTYRKSDYFRANVPANNAAGPVYQTNTVRGVRPDGTNDVMTEETRTVLLPPATEAFTYDDDGNLLTDGIWSYTWDAENRLIQMTNLTTVASAARKKLEFKYDYIGRRVQKDISTWNGSGWNSAVTTKFIYDDWNLLAEIDSTNGTIRSYLWGSDLSDSSQGAGGVGGLLAFTDNSPDVTRHSPCYDGNGNIIALAKSNGGTSTEYEYGPFGEAIRVTGNAGAANPFRFSTKYLDTETDLLYYGYRYYSASAGRWLSSDPMTERQGALNYTFVENAAVHNVDPHGENAYNTVGNQRIYDMVKNTYYRAILFRPGDTIITKNDTIRVITGDLWPFKAGSNLAKLQCLLNRLGFNLPPSTYGVYLATFSSGSANAWTVTYGIPDKRPTFFDIADMSKVTTGNAEFRAVTMWHELKGHGADGDQKDGANFDKKYEAPVLAAIAKLKAAKTPANICASCLPVNGKPWQVRNQFDRAMCDCDIRPR